VLLNNGITSSKVLFVYARLAKGRANIGHLRFMHLYFPKRIGTSIEEKPGNGNTSFKNKRRGRVLRCGWVSRLFRQNKNPE